MRVNRYLLALLLLLFFSGCSKDDDGPKSPTIDDNGEVSQYEARDWDGVKRADIYYEIFVRSFADSDGDKIGDLNGITEKLEYLNELGVAGIWLTPINPSPSYHGYDVEDYKAINPEFGTMEDFEGMIKRARELKIKVILDLVVNHTSKTHPWFVEACSSEDNPYRDYYLFGNTSTLGNDIAQGKIPMTNEYYPNQWHRVASGTTNYSYMGWFSNWMPEVNYGAVDECENSETFKEMCDIAKFWIDKGVDGFRLDAIKHIYQNENSDENPEFWRKFYDALKEYKSDIYMVGEMYASSSEIAPYYKGLQAHFEFEGWEKLKYAVNNNHAKWFPKDLLEYAAKYEAVREDYIQATKLSNHDEDRTRSVFDNSIDKSKIAAAIHLTVSGSPYIYYGEEIGMRGMKNHGDEYVREPFLWAPEREDEYRTKWIAPAFSVDALVDSYKLQKGDSKSIWRLYEKFIELRNTYPALAHGEMRLPDGFDDGESGDKHLMIFYRVAQEESLYVIHNVSRAESTYKIPETLKRPIADFGGVEVTLEGGRHKVKMPPYTTVIFEM